MIEQRISPEHQVDPAAHQDKRGEYARATRRKSSRGSSRNLKADAAAASRRSSDPTGARSSKKEGGGKKTLRRQRSKSLPQIETKPRLPGAREKHIADRLARQSKRNLMASEINRSQRNLFAAEKSKSRRSLMARGGERERSESRRNLPATPRSSLSPERASRRNLLAAQKKNNGPISEGGSRRNLMSEALQNCQGSTNAAAGSRRSLLAARKVRAKSERHLLRHSAPPGTMLGGDNKKQPVEFDSQMVVMMLESDDRDKAMEIWKDLKRAHNSTNTNNLTPAA